jgi:mannose-1-phosphate guanylyltransferase
MKLLITAGGSGGKLWPISNDDTPKQFSQILDHKSLFRHNLEILLSKYSPKEIFISTKKQFSHFMDEQAPEISKENIFFEPDYKRDTGPGTLYPLLILSILFPNEPMILIQSVCYREPKNRFLDMLDAMEQMVVKYNEPITGGMRPEYPDMGSDYLRVGARGKSEIVNDVQFYKSDEFVWRTGDLEKTKKLIQENSVFFHTNHLCWYPSLILKEVEKYKQDWHIILEEIKARIISSKQAPQDVDIDDLFEKFSLGKIEDISSHFFNNRGLVAEVPYNWLHVASWNSIYEALDKDVNHNAMEGDVKTYDSNNNLILQKVEGKKIVFIGIENTIFVETKDSILVCDMSSVADVKKYTEGI